MRADVLPTPRFFFFMGQSAQSHPLLFKHYQVVGIKEKEIIRNVHSNKRMRPPFWSRTNRNRHSVVTPQGAERWLQHRPLRSCKPSNTDCTAGTTTKGHITPLKGGVQSNFQGMIFKGPFTWKEGALRG